MHACHPTHAVGLSFCNTHLSVVVPSKKSGLVAESLHNWMTLKYVGEGCCAMDPTHALPPTLAFASSEDPHENGPIRI
jgi:hypothetical protein